MSANNEEKDVKLNVDITATIECKSQSNPGYFLHRISKAGPHVVMPDGILYRGSYGREHMGEFSNEIAKIYAEAHDGIYFESPGNYHPGFKFADYVEAIRRLLPHVDNYKPIKDLANDPKVLEEIAAEEKFLEKVHPWIGVDMFGASTVVAGLYGEIVDREKEKTKYFGPVGNQYNMTLKLDLGSFGYRHFSIQCKYISAKIRTAPRVYSLQPNPTELDAAFEYVKEQNKEGGDKFEICFQKEDNKIDKSEVILTLKSPGNASGYNRNEKLEDQVSSTQDMINSFGKVADKLANVFVELVQKKTEKEKRKKEKAKQIFA